MQYFAMSQQNRASQFRNGQPNPIYTEVFPDQDFAGSGYWFWLKSTSAHGFDVKAFDQNYVYIRSTELVWTNNTTFKRFVSDLPIAARCVASNSPRPEIQVADTSFQYFSSCSPYKSSNPGNSTFDQQSDLWQRQRNAALHHELSVAHLASCNGYSGDSSSSFPSSFFP
jgi:hypothetical protein